jgi:hypothetical protein
VRTIVVIGLTNKVAYNFSVTATSAFGTSSLSQPSSLVVPRTVITWDGSTGLWSDSTHWKPQQLPTLNDIALIQSGYVGIDSSTGTVVVDTLRLTGSGHLELADSSIVVTVVHTLDIASKLLTGSGTIIMNPSLDTLGLINNVTIVNGYLPSGVSVTITPPADNSWSTVINGNGISGAWTIHGITYWMDGSMDSGSFISVDHLAVLKTYLVVTSNAQMNVTSSLYLPSSTTIAIFGAFFLSSPSSASASSMRIDGTLDLSQSAASLTILSSTTTSSSSNPLTIANIAGYSSRITICNGCDVWITRSIKWTECRVTSDTALTTSTPPRVLLAQGCVVNDVTVTLYNGVYIAIPSTETVTWLVNTPIAITSSPVGNGMYHVARAYPLFFHFFHACHCHMIMLINNSWFRYQWFLSDSNSLSNLISLYHCNISR